MVAPISPIVTDRAQQDLFSPHWLSDGPLPQRHLVAKPLKQSKPAKSSESKTKPASFSAFIEEPLKAPTPAARKKATVATVATAAKVLPNTPLFSPSMDWLGDTSRSHLDWLAREDNAAVNAVLCEPSVATLFDLACQFKRDPLLVAKHLLASEVSEMAGLEAQTGSEEEVEFLGLALAGVPLALVLKWCAATEDQADRPTWSVVEASMTAADWRPSLILVRETGIWLSTVDQLSHLASLQDMDAQDVKRAVDALIDRIEAPSPRMVFEEMCGMFEGAAVVNWASLGHQSPHAPKGTWKSSPKKSRTSPRTRIIRAGEGRKATSYKRKSSSTKRGFHSGYAKKSKRYSKKQASPAF